MDQLCRPRPARSRFAPCTALYVGAVLLSSAAPATAEVARVWGAKSCGSSLPTCGAVASAVPTHLYSFTPGIASFVDHGPLTLGASNIIVDALAQSAIHGLLGFQLTTDANGVVISSRLVSIDTSTATATAVGPQLARDVRGAAFGRHGQLFVLDVRTSTVLQVDPESGVELTGSETPLSLGSGGAFSLSTMSDVALRSDGRYYLVSLNQIFELDIESGVLALVRLDPSQGFAGATFADGSGADELRVFEVSGTDDLLRYDLDTPGVPASIEYGDILSFFNAGRGDLASRFPHEASAYCTAGTTANGCNASISSNVNPNVAHTSGCQVSIAGVEGQKSGIVFYGISGKYNAPWCAGGGSVLCVNPPTQRMGVQGSGGSSGACDGALVQDWDAFQIANPIALGNPWSIGDVVHVQAWFRDPPSCRTTSLSNALELTYQP